MAEMTSALKKLLKEKPTKDDISRCVNELTTDGTRGTAVLAAALLEDLLRLCILTKMVELSKDEHDRLFIGAGPLSSFSTKTQFAYALGTIGPRVRHDLDSIREIRNALAHTNLKIDFDTPEVAALCAGLHCLAAIEDPADVSIAQTAKGRFIQATKALMIHIISKWTPANVDVIPQKLRDLG
jgi:DNA-binding MltR family transcriptional regulator